MRVARFFTETRQVAWVLLIGTLLWGVYGYTRMPQRKDPEIPIPIVAVVCPWPGVSAAQIEALVTRPVEQRVSENRFVTKVTSTTRTNVAIVLVELVEGLPDPPKEFEDITSRLDTLSLPQGAGPVQVLKDFADTATLMLTVASPRVAELEIDLRARGIRQAIEDVRAGAAGSRVTVVFGFPPSVTGQAVRRVFRDLQRAVDADGIMRDTRLIDGHGFVGLDGETSQDDGALEQYGARFVREHLQASEFHPDAWRPAFIRDPADVGARLAQAAGDKYTYRELEAFTELIQRTLQARPLVSRVTRSGVLPEQVFLTYSQERLAQYGVRPLMLRDVLGARNITLPGGILEVGDAASGPSAARNLRIDPSGAFRAEQEIGNVLVPVPSGRAVYVRDLVDVERGYQTPARFLNYHRWKDAAGHWQRTRAVTLAVQMRSGGQIAAFGREMDAALADLRHRLPEDLVLARTSDQPLQVQESIGLFTRSLAEALVLVVIVSWIGFWDWRSAVLMALSVPLTLAMTFGMMQAFGVDLQQVSIASLIIALGLLVDVPVVAGDAIKRDMGAGQPRAMAAWRGPGRLLPAMTYATITNVVAYLPFLTISGNVGNFLYSLPIVITASLVAALLVSITFVPLIGSFLLRPVIEPSMDERRQRGCAAFYCRAGGWAIDHRWAVLGASFVLLAGGWMIGTQLKTQFFPKDLSYLSYVDVWLPEDAPLSATAAAAEQVEGVIRDVAQTEGRPLASLTTFLGGGAPRFWFSVSPELSQLNYAQILIRLERKEDTSPLVAPLQVALDARLAGARVDVRQLETGEPVGVPVAIRVVGDDEETLRENAARLTAVLRADPRAVRIRNDWGSEAIAARVEIDADRANLAGVTNLDVALSSVAGINGFPVSTLRDGRLEIPVVARMRMSERARLSDIRNMYVYAAQGGARVPLSQVASIRYGLESGKIVRRQQFRTMTVSAFPAGGVLASEVLETARPGIDAVAAGLPPGYRLEIAGEYEKQQKGFGELAFVMALSIGLIFLALVIQFKDVVKPFVVFAAIPYGVAGAIVALWAAGEPFGFMAFLGVASLVGVVVSHIIVLFDFIEEQQAHGVPLRQALLDAGILRLRPVLITVVAFLMALIPLAAHGGPLWEPMCYAQIGGLIVATFITLLIVPVFYSILVLDLRLIRWER